MLGELLSLLVVTLGAAALLPQVVMAVIPGAVAAMVLTLAEVMVVILVACKFSRNSSPSIASSY
jgi:hypothetical protein